MQTVCLEMYKSWQNNEDAAWNFSRRVRTIIRKKEQWGAGIQLNLDYEISINLRTDKVENIFIYYLTLFDILWHHLSKTYNKFVVVVENLNLIESIET